MDATAIGVVGFFVGLSGGEMERAANLFVKESIKHGVDYAIVSTKRPFTTIAGAWVGIEDCIETFGFVCSGFRDFAVVKLELDIAESCTLVPGPGVKPNRTINTLFHRSGKNLTVRDVPQAIARDDGDILDRKLKFCSMLS